MKYYKRNLGDYAGATRHLSMLEHGAYSLLLDTYYVTERHLPSDFSRLCRLLGVRSKQEKLAVESVLADFFVKSDDGWHQERCDVEIANAQEFGEEREERTNNEKERQRRHRERRKQLFAELREHGIVPAWDASTSRLRELLSQATGKPVTPDVTDDVTLPVTLPVTPPVTPATAIDIKQETVLKKNTPLPPKGGRRRATKTGDDAEGFAEFYAKYPRHVARAAAERAWSKLDPDEPLRERIMAALVHNGFDYRENGRFIPHPATWLNAARWDDEQTLEIEGVSEQASFV